MTSRDRHARLRAEACHIHVRQGHVPQGCGARLHPSRRQVIDLPEDIRAMVTEHGPRITAACC